MRSPGDNDTETSPVPSARYVNPLPGFCANGIWIVIGSAMPKRITTRREVIV